MPGNHGLIGARVTVMDKPEGRGDVRGARVPDGLIAAGLAVLAGLVRLIPHPFNLTPVGALGLFGGARLRPWLAATLPLAVMAVTDLILKWALDYPAFNPYVYGCFLANVLLGRLLARTQSWVRIGGLAVAGSVLFFVVTNFGVWLGSSVPPETLATGAAYAYVQDSPYPFPLIRYARSPQGLLACYWLAAAFSAPEAPPLGFFGNLLVGDLFFTGLLFGAHALLASGVPRPRNRRSEAMTLAAR
jgi:hypothetical protein